MAAAMEEASRTIALSRAKLKAMVPACAVVLVSGIALCAHARDDAIVTPALDQAAGLLAILFGAACGLYLLRKLVDRRPGLVLTPLGLTDNSSGVAMGFVPWEDIAGVEARELMGQRMLVFHLVDVEKYVRRHGVLTRPVARSNVAFCGSPLVIAPHALAIEFDELRRVVGEFRARAAAPASTG
jgi:hypothetical protein